MKKSLKYLLIIVFHLSLAKDGFSQKNSLSVTPLNALIFESTELTYERIFGNYFAINADAKIWFLDREPIPFFISGKPDGPTFKRNVCKGSRYSLGLHKYFFTKNKKTGTVYIGVGAFYGHHTLEKYYDDSYGKIETGNYGVKLSHGYRVKLKCNIFFDVGFDFGQSWMTQGATSFSLYDPSGEVRRVERIEMPVYGPFIDPKIAVGYAF